MHQYIIFNGTAYLENTPVITASNSGLKYGDGLFETIKLLNGKICNSVYHFDRLLEGLQLLNFNYTAAFSAAALEQQLYELVALNKHLPDARVRLMVLRNESQAPNTRDTVPDWIISSHPLAPHYLALNPVGLKLGICPDVKKAADKYAHLKSNNYQKYAIASRYGIQRGWDDTVILNTYNRIVETTIANLFYLKEGKLFTPPLSEGPIAGTMRRKALRVLPAAGWPIIEQPVELQDLMNADAIYLSNALYGIRWVGEFMGKQFAPADANELYSSLQNQSGD